MRQILQNLKNGDIELAEVPVPMVKAGHLLIRTVRTLISLGTERMLLEFGKAGWLDKARQQPDRVRQVWQKIRTDGLSPTVNAVFHKLDQPLALGYCQTGIVIEVGSGLDGWRPGDRVISNGNHAEVVCIPEHLCARIPDEVSDETAVFTVIASIALEGVRLVEPTLGACYAVLGLGLIGQLTVQLLKANGCRVIGFDFDPRKVDLARKYGAEAGNLAAGVDPVQAARHFSGGHGVDGVLITASTRSSEPVHQAPQMCRKRGKVVLVGVTGLDMARDDFYKKEITFQVSCSYGPGRYDPAYEKKGLDFPIGFVRWTEQRNFEAVLGLMRERKIRADDLISARVTFGEALTAYEQVLADPTALGIVLEYEGTVDPGKRAVALSSGPLVPSAPAAPVAGFIGAGNFAGSTLIPAFRAAGVALRAIASSGGVSGTHLGRKNGFAISMTDHRLILRDPEINTVVITTPHDSHAGFVRECLTAGKHVFVEKPLCLNEADLESLIRLVSASACSPAPLVMVGFNRRFAPLVQTMKTLLATIPAPKALTMTVNAGAIPAEHWTQDRETGGGRIIGEACHFIDLLRFLVAAPISRISSCFLSPAGGGGARVFDTAVMQLGFADGSVGSIQYLANGHKDFPKERLEVFADGRILQLDNFISLTGFGWPSFSREKLWSQDKGHQNCVRAFADAIMQGKAAPIPWTEIVEVTRATLAAAAGADRAEDNAEENAEGISEDNTPGGRWL